MTTNKLELWRLREQRRLESELRAALDRCLFDRADWVLGPEVAAFEHEFSTYLKSPHGVAVSSGTAALELTLRALGIGAGANVIVPALTHVATAMAVVRAGAIPQF